MSEKENPTVEEETQPVISSEEQAEQLASEPEVKPETEEQQEPDVEVEPDVLEEPVPEPEPETVETPKRRKRRKKKEKKITVEEFEGVPTDKAFVMFDKFPNQKAWWRYWEPRVTVITKKQSRELQKKVQRYDDLWEAYQELKKVADK